MAWIPLTVDEALKKMEKRTQYLAYWFSFDYPPMRGDLEQAGRIATERSFRKYRPGGPASFETYCGKAIKRGMISEKKRQMKDFENGMVEAPDEDFIEKNATEEDGVLSRERWGTDKAMKKVWEVAGRLPPQEQRIIAWMAEDLSTTEMARALHLSERQTQRIRNQAISKLREFLDSNSMLGIVVRRRK